jgi:hypothetical protein
MGTSTNWWWFDPAKADRLEQRREAQPSAEVGDRDRPDYLTILSVAAGLLFAGYFVFRRVLQRPSM